MGRWWTMRGGKRVRTAAGVRHELGICSLKGNSIFKGREILSSNFVPFPSSIWEPGVPPRGLVSAFNKGNVFLLSYPIAAYSICGIITILFRGDKAQIATSIIKPISVNVVNKYPSIIRSSTYHCVVDEIALESCIPIYMQIQTFTFVTLFPNIFIKLSISNEFVFVIVQRGFYPVAMVNSFSKDSFLSERRESHFAIRPAPIAPTGTFDSFDRVFIWHNGIIPRTTKFHNKESYYG